MIRELTVDEAMGFIGGSCPGQWYKSYQSDEGHTYNFANTPFTGTVTKTVYQDSGWSSSYGVGGNVGIGQAGVSRSEPVMTPAYQIAISPNEAAYQLYRSGERAGYADPFAGYHNNLSDGDC
jgi:hypothetical protein